MADLWIGMSGWSYAEWREHFYPPGLPSKDWLAYFSSRFRTVELNATFYRFPASSVLEGWRTSVADGFRFAVKANRRLTHVGEMPKSVDLSSFLERVQILQDRLGPVLFQFPPSRKRDDEWLASYLGMLSQDLRYVFEFRHKSWFEEPVYEQLRKRNVAFCVHDFLAAGTPLEVTADFAYVRFRGPDGPENTHYAPETLELWVGRIKELATKAREVYTYMQHDLAGLQDCLFLKSQLGAA